jgi:hypothetical protein
MLYILKWKMFIIITTIVAVGPSSQPLYECLRLDVDLFCNEWYGQQQSQCLTIQVSLRFHAVCPQLSQQQGLTSQVQSYTGHTLNLNVACNGNIICINIMECISVCSYITYKPLVLFQLNVYSSISSNVIMVTNIR